MIKITIVNILCIFEMLVPLRKVHRSFHFNNKIILTIYLLKLVISVASDVRYKFLKIIFFGLSLASPLEIM